MPLTLFLRTSGKTKIYYVRRVYLGQRVYRSTKTGKRAIAKKLLQRWEREIEQGEFVVEGEPTFCTAAIDYMNAGGERTYLAKLIEHFKDKPLKLINQAAVDEAACVLYPEATNATRNRQVYTPVSAILKRAGFEQKLARPERANGDKRTTWLWPEQTERLFAEAEKIDKELACLLITLCYTGMRLSEALGLATDRVRLSEGFAYLPTSKTEEPRAVFLNPFVVTTLANHPRGMEREGRVFRFHHNGHLRKLFQKALKAAGIDLPQGTAFHVFCHTWATWMRRYGGLDTKGLIATGRWKDRQSVDRYEHVVVSEEATKALLLPTPSAKSVQTGSQQRKT